MTAHNHECDSGDMDRVMCACGAMHFYCTVCGENQDGCPLDYEVIPVNTNFGFEWGPVEVTRIAHFRPRKDRECYVVEVNNLNIYVSRTGRSVRVFKNGKELK